MLPVPAPVTWPVALMVATPGLALLHTPPVAASVRVTGEPIHTDDGPVIVPATADGLTVTAVVA